MAKDVVMPVLGMNQETGTLVEWLKAEGDSVVKGEPLMVVATDKTEVEIEATAAGVLANVEVQAGGEVPVGSVIALIVAPGETAPPRTAAPAKDQASSTPAQEDRPAPVASPVAARIAAQHNVDLGAVQAGGARIQKEDVLAHLTTQSAISRVDGARQPASPKARRLAREAGLELADLVGSGPDGAVLAADVVAATVAPAPAIAAPTLSGEVQPMSRGWKVMAQRLQESWRSVPHFYLEREIDATALLAWRKSAQQRMAQKLTVTDLLTKVVAMSLRRHPRLNASWIDEQIVQNPEINVGLAVAVEEGLLVPVIHAADDLGLAQIAAQRADVVTRALEGTLPLDALQHGTFTISNLGMFGITKFNAIVNPPQAAILAVGAIADRIVAVKGKAKVRPMMTLTLSCDHRVVDGARGAQFLQTLAEQLTDPLGLLD